jgi:hypothetical protein
VLKQRERGELRISSERENVHPVLLPSPRPVQDCIKLEKHTIGNQLLMGEVVESGRVP